MRLLIFVAVILGIAIVFGAVYGVSAVLERRKRQPAEKTFTKTVAPDDDPEFLRNLARKLDEDSSENDK